MNEDREFKKKEVSADAENQEFEVRIDASEFSIIEITFPKEVTRAALDRHFQSLIELAADNRRFALLINLDPLLTNDKEIRSHAAAKIAEANRIAGDAIICIAHLSDNWLSRAVLTVVTSAVRTPYPERTFRKRSAAVAWIRSKLPKD